MNNHILLLIDNLIYLYYTYINRLKVEKLEAMSKLHTHFITNAQKELKYVYTGLSEDDFQSSIQQALSNAAKTNDDFIEENDDDADFSDEEEDNTNDNEEENYNTRNTEIEQWINIDSSDLTRLLEVDVRVVIEPHPITIDHGSRDFNIETTLDNVLGNNT